MTEPLQELLHRMRRDLVRAGDHEKVSAVVDLLTATAVVDELAVAMDHGDDLAVAFHAEILQRVLAEMRPLDFSVTRS